MKVQVTGRCIVLWWYIAKSFIPQQARPELSDACFRYNGCH